MAATSLRLWFFGAFAVEVDGEPMRPPRWRKSQWLLVLLALRQGRDVPRPWLAETLWPDTGLAGGLFNLRHTLAQDLRPSLGAASALIRASTPSTLCLDVDGVWSDVSGFDAAISNGKALDEAVSLCKGPFLDGCTEEWAVQERVTREEAFYAALETQAAQAMGRLEFAKAVGLLRLCIAGAPIRETAHVALMGALSASGDQAGVTQAYRDLRVILRRELNSEPDEQTRALYERLRTEAHLHLLPASDPSASLAASIPRRLPVPLTRLIGREREIEEVLDRFTQGRLVTLLGVGGVGKTRLSIAVAEELAKDCPDGEWFVELAALENPDLVSAAVAQTLQVRDQPGRTIEEALADALAFRSLLIVLDNCEHLLNSISQVAERLLTHVPGLRVLATSRQPLAITGEWIYRVPSLEYPRSEAALAYSDKNKSASHGLMEYDAIRLFIQRAAAQKERFKPTAEQVLAIAEICELLDGIPLAIEMAAARTRNLAIEEIITRLADMFTLLCGGSRTALPRHQTLRALIDWSYGLLNEQEKLLLARLSVFAGEWTLAAAEAVCGTVRDGGIGCNCPLALTLSRRVERGQCIFPTTWQHPGLTDVACG